MAFMSLMFGSLFALILFVVTLIGLLVLVLGVIFLIVYLIRRKKKASKGFLIAAITLLCVGIPMSSILPVLSIAGSFASKMMTVDHTLYHNDFSGDLYLLNMDDQDDYILLMDTNSIG